MDEATKLGFEFAKEVATQLITLSTALLTLTIAFTKDLFSGKPRHGQIVLPLAWAVHLLSIIFGVLTLMALTGTLMPVESESRQLRFGPNVRVMAAVQIVCFAIGTVLLVWHGVLAYEGTGAQPAEYRSIAVVIGDLQKTLVSESRSGWELVQIVPEESGQLIVVWRRNSAAT